MTAQIRDSIRQVLLNDWDPHNAARSEAAHGTYDQYIAPLWDLIQSGADEAETMCFPSLGTQRLRPVAQKLLALRTRA
jgi:hypothetical protein